MRLHTLEITAFGPFGDTVTVDFDALSAAGVFLLTGPTGAGKSSVLDAVCFALYGDVPGDRATAKRLRSDHAAPGVGPHVRLECTLAGRRFRIARSPAWERPKKRGTGTTQQQAGVSVSERVEGGWQPLTTRLDEAGHLVSHLLGMNLTQFTQVALLPQGRFQSFLRARSDERHRLLQQLFRTGRFEAVEAWLRQRRSELAGLARDQQHAVAELASRVSETAGRPLPESWVGSHPDDEGSAAVLGEWASALLSEHQAAAAEQAALVSTATVTAKAAVAALESARVLAERQQRHRAATDERARLLEGAEAMDRLRAAVSAARRAAVVVPLERERAAAESRRVTSDERLRAQTLLARPWVSDPSDDLVATRAAELTRDLAATEVLLPEQRRLQGLLTQAARLDEERVALDAELATLEVALSERPVRLAELTTQHASALADATTVTQARVDLAAAEARAAAAVQLVELRAAHQIAVQVRGRAIDAAQTARESWLGLQEQRITGMAAELAGQLAVGGNCPVCGSVEHPDPARPHPGAPDVAAEREARRLLDDAEAERHLREDAVRDLHTQIAIAERGSDGLSPEAAAQAVDRLAHRAATLTESSARAPELQARLSALQDSQRADERRREDLRLSRERTASRLAALISQTDDLSRVVAGALVDSADGSLEAKRRRLARGVAQLADLAAALRDAAAASEHAARATAATRQAAVEAGFAGPAEALAAVLPHEEIEEAESALSAHAAGLEACERVLSDPVLAEAAGQPAADLDRHQRSADAGTALLLDAEAAARSGARALGRLTELVAALLEQVRTSAPVREELALTTRLSSFVDGRSPDNRLQMRLSAYVLAARLGQVVDAANLRLSTMSDRRYALEHTGRRGAGETRGGLSLLVRDDWTGETRDPATLSGGETFVVSLALALGLADTVAHEAGGADLDTLFVDEGFGALDADTLDDVLDTLDSLRDGGRVVGVVSHVPQMRERIPTHLDVHKGREGSRLRLTHG